MAPDADGALPSQVRPGEVAPVTPTEVALPCWPDEKKQLELVGGVPPARLHVTDTLHPTGSPSPFWQEADQWMVMLARPPSPISWNV